MGEKTSKLLNSWEKFPRTQTKQKLKIIRCKNNRKNLIKLGKLFKQRKTNIDTSWTNEKLIRKYYTYTKAQQSRRIARSSTTTGLKRNDLLSNLKQWSPCRPKHSLINDPIPIQFLSYCVLSFGYLHKIALCKPSPCRIWFYLNWELWDRTSKETQLSCKIRNWSGARTLHKNEKITLPKQTFLYTSCTFFRTCL